MRSTWLLALASLVLAACGGADASPAPLDESDAAGTEALATMTLIDRAAERQRAGADGFVTAATGDVLGDQDVVRTDATGFIEILYVDGSLTRLDADTEFEVVAVSGTAEAAEIRTRLEVGRVFNRVESVTTGGSFALETSVAVATVRGTEFVAECRVDRSCTFTGVEDTVVVTVGVDEYVVNAGSRLVVQPDGDTDGPEDLGVDRVADDPWVVRNHAQGPPPGEDEASGGLGDDEATTDVSGQWRMTVDVTVANGVCAGEEEDPPSTRTVQIDQDGSRITVSDVLALASLEGIVEGRTVEFGGTQPEDDGVTTTAFVLELLEDGSMTGIERWSWEGESGTCPDGRSDVTAVRA